MAACNEAQQMLEGSESQSSTFDIDHSDVESLVELMVTATSTFGDRSSELWPFDHRPFDVQMEQLAGAFEVPHGVLIHSHGSELEVIQSLAQLQALPMTAQLTLEHPQMLIQQLMSTGKSESSLRPLVSTLCATPELTMEAFRQDAGLMLLKQLCSTTETMELLLASTGLCALMRLESAVPTLRAQLLDQWSEHGKPLMRRLMNDGNNGATRAVLLWLLEELEVALDTLHIIAMEDEGGYARFFDQHPTVLRWAVAKAENVTPPRKHIVEAACEQCPAIKEKETLDTDMLKLLMDSFVDFGRSCGGSQKLVQQGKWLKEEKHFVEQLQRKLRCAIRSLRAMVPLVSLQDADLEKSLQKIVVEGWDSTDWPDGQNLLHFLCEHNGDVRAIRLAAELCPDLEVRDGQNLRAMDYALRNPDSAVAEQLLLVSQERLGQSFLEEDVLKEDVFKADETRMLCPDGSADSTEEVEGMEGGVEGDDEPRRREQLGALFMMRTRLAKALKENDQLKEKVGELELLRTRLAILSEKPEPPSHPSLPELPSAPLKKMPTLSGCLESGSTSAEDGDSADSAAESEPPASASEAVDVDPTPVDPTPVAPSPTSPQSRTEMEPGSPTDAAAATPSKPPPKGKGKGKGKAPAAPAEGETANSSGASSGGGSKGEGKGKSKGKGKVQVEPTKPEVKPAQDLKTIPWTRYVVGAQIQEGSTIWDQVNQVYEADHIMEALPLDEIEKRFGKSIGLPKPAQNVEKKEVKKPKTVKLTSIAQEQRFQIEVCLRTLPVSLNTGSKAARAVQDLDRSALTVEAINSLRRFLCPNAEQEQELRSKRQSATESETVLLWDPVEQYMEDLLQISGCSLRLSCWEFLYNLPERLAQLQENLLRFERMVHSFLTSTEIPFLLSLVLAFGNYLNGGKNEKRLGRADGFHVELLGRPGGLELVNDTQGRNVRQLIFETFCEKYPSHSERLFQELAPTFALVQRRIGKDSQGVPAVRKSVRVEIEDLDKQLSQLKSEFAKKHQEMKEGLKLIDDPAEKFVIEIPPEFDRAKQHIDDLIRKKDSTLQQFKAVLSNFKAETYRGDPIVVDGQVKDGNPKSEMTSDVWCKIWDDFFVPSERVLSFDEKRLKSLIEPRFCKDEPLTVESLALLWGLNKEEPRRKSTVVSRKSVCAASRRRASA